MLGNTLEQIKKQSTCYKNKQMDRRNFDVTNERYISNMHWLAGKEGQSFIDLWWRLKLFVLWDGK